MAKDLVRWMHALFWPKGESCGDACWQPSADIYRTPGGWLIKFDLAGVRPEDVEVLLSGRRLMVHGTRRDSCLEEGCHYHRLEITYSRFSRTIELPPLSPPYEGGDDLGSAHITTEYRDGLLLVRIEKETLS